MSDKTYAPTQVKLDDECGRSIYKRRLSKNYRVSWCYEDFSLNNVTLIDKHGKSKSFAITSRQHKIHTDKKIDYYSCEIGKN